MTKKNWLCRGLILVLCLAICLSTVACSGKKGDESSEPVGTTGSGTMTYTVQVTAETGTPLEKIGVYIYTDSTMSELVWFAKTDAEGKLTFTDIPSDNFVAVLADVPAGYLVEETYPLTGENTVIKLSAGLMDGDLSTVTYKLGDLMLDFSVTGPDGTQYKFSELLEQKKAVILNFWYLQCEPCKAEFPHLQEAYEKYSDDVALLVMNPVNQDNAEIEQFRKDNGYTFPMMACDPLWANAMQITAYPTTVVIDRYGYITLRHTGSIDGPETFEAMMDYFSAEDYEHRVFENLSDLEESAGVEQIYGTPENPIQMGAQSSFQVTVEPGQEMHYEFYRIATTYYLSLRNENAYILYNGKKYTPTAGSINFPVSAEDTNSTVKMVFGNTGTETQTYTVTMSTEQGSMGNPFALKLGEFTANVPAGKEQGIFYTFYPDMDGVFTLELKSATAGVNYDISVTSIRNEIPVQKKLSEDSLVNTETGHKMVAVNAYKGGRVDINIGTFDGSGNRPAASFVLIASLKEGTLDDLAKTTVRYCVNVTDENGNPVSGARLSMTVDGKEKELTGSNGVYSSYEEAGTYTVKLVVPRGFTAKTTTFKLTEKYPSVSIKLNTIEKATYTVTVVDSVTGELIEGAEVYFNDASGELLTSAVTDASGKVEITTSKDTYSVSVVMEGYISDAITLTPEEKDATVALVEGIDENTTVYTVNAVDYFGSAVSGMKVTFTQNGAIKATADVVNGVATRRLLPGTYTVGVAGNYATPGATVTESQTTATITVIAGVTGKTDEASGEKVPVLELGATYVKPQIYSADNYYLFYPTASGRYEFKFLNNKLEVSSTMIASYQGANAQTPNNQSELLNTPKEKELGNYYDNKNNTFVINIRESYLGNTYVLGLKQAKDAVIVIKRIGDALTDETDLKEEEYRPKSNNDPKKFTMTQSGNLKYVDIVNGKTSDYVPVLGGDGYYHLNSQDGPLLYMNIGPEMTGNIQLSNLCGQTGSGGESLYKIIRDENGVGLYREVYTGLLYDYCANRDSLTGLYPLTYDLMIMIQNGGEHKEWWNYTENPDGSFVYSQNYNFFKNDTGTRVYYRVNKEIAWMFAVCYIEN